VNTNGGNSNLASELETTSEHGSGGGGGGDEAFAYQSFAPVSHNFGTLVPKIHETHHKIRIIDLLSGYLVARQKLDTNRE